MRCFQVFPYVTCFGFSRQSHGWVFFFAGSPQLGEVWCHLGLPDAVLSAVRCAAEIPPLPVIGVGRVSALLLPSEGCDEVSHLAR